MAEDLFTRIDLFLGPHGMSAEENKAKVQQINDVIHALTKGIGLHFEAETGVLADVVIDD